jgi:phosphoribosylformylglycinamidine synthase
MPPEMLIFLAPEILVSGRNTTFGLEEPVVDSLRPLYLVLVERGPEGDEEERLERLLQAERVSEDDGGSDLFDIVPHRGTVSPWSSKATDLAQRIGLGLVRRLERGLRCRIRVPEEPSPSARTALVRRWLVEKRLLDRMTQDVVTDRAGLRALFDAPPSNPLVVFEPKGDPQRALAEGTRRLGLVLDPDERAWLAAHYTRVGRSPTDAELMTFAQINSEHCRHKHFRTPWRLPDGTVRTLFSFITATHEAHPGPVLVAYRDNAAVLRGVRSRLPVAVGTGRAYTTRPILRHVVVKAETHNHPTAIEPYSGAATGAGGEIRDESATGRGARPSMGFVGFITSHLCLDLDAPLDDEPENPGEPWEQTALVPPGRIAPARDIMIRAPVGVADYGNEFGRPTLAGFFRTFETLVSQPLGLVRGYHKPVLIAGGSGYVTEASFRKGRVTPGQKIVVLGGPSYRIGLGGGSLSSRAAGEAEEDLDYASVQRGNAEMERRVQETIDALSAGAGPNPIVAIHDVGAGGLANAVTELVAEGGCGARIESDAVPRDDPSLGPMELWCNESQERYVLALEESDLARLREAAERERCPWAILGTVTAERRILLVDRTGVHAVDLPLDTLFPPPAADPRPLPPPPPAPSVVSPSARETIAEDEIPELVSRVLRAPAVADKSFLVTIADRSVGGRTARDPLVGPFQVAVADVAVQCDDLRGRRGRALALGERPPVALLDPGAASRLAAAEALLNLAAADVPSLSAVALSANWMAARGRPEEDHALFQAVSALSAFALALGIPIPVGKDSLAMETAWTVREAGEEKRWTVRAPVTVVVSAFAPVVDAGRTLTALWSVEGQSALVLLAPGPEHRLGGSVLETVRTPRGEGPQESGSLGPPADVSDPEAFVRLFALVRRLARRGVIRAYHDRSDGGLLVTLLEMAFASARGLDIELPPGVDPAAALFAEESGAVVEVASGSVASVLRAARRAGVHARVVGRPRPDTRVRFLRPAGGVLHEDRLVSFRKEWSRLSLRMRRRRDDRDTAVAAYACDLKAALPAQRTSAAEAPETVLSDEERRRMDPIVPFAPGLAARLTFDPADPLSGGERRRRRRPRVGILREEGTNGHLELAEAFARAGFAPIDLPMSALHRRPNLLERIDVLAAGGGFSYGDVLDAGRGWALALASDPPLRRVLGRFLANEEKLVLGICNGCQMLAALADLTREEKFVPGTAGWPRFGRNVSRRFESRWVNVVVDPASQATPWLRGMSDSLLPVPVAHGEGRAESVPGGPAFDPSDRRVVLRYADATGAVAQESHYPANPNGSGNGAAGLVNADGRIMILMPHPERAFRTLQYSWHPPGWSEDAPWLRLFRNARVRVLGG